MEMGRASLPGTTGLRLLAWTTALRPETEVLVEPEPESVSEPGKMSALPALGSGQRKRRTRTRPEERMTCRGEGVRCRRVGSPRN